MKYIVLIYCLFFSPCFAVQNPQNNIKGNFEGKYKNDKLLSILTDYDTCTYLSAWEAIRPQSPEEAKQQYDTLRMYIEKCAKNDDSYRAFTSLSGAVQIYSLDTSRFDLYRQWLISVLFLNTTNPTYFCACVSSLSGTFQFGKYRYRATHAILNYLRHNKHCEAPGLDIQFSSDSAYIANHGIDTALVPLDSLGLGFLDSLAKAGVHSPSISQGIYLASFTSSPNPFIKETTLEFTLNRMAYITLEIYDELGRVVWGDSKGSSLEAGVHTIHLDGNSLPRGTLYARISTGFGEVKTVKLVHE